MCVSCLILFGWAWKDSGEYSTGEYSTGEYSWKDSGEYSTEVHNSQDTVKPVLSL